MTLWSPPHFWSLTSSLFTNLYQSLSQQQSLKRWVRLMNMPRAFSSCLKQAGLLLSLRMQLKDGWNSVHKDLCHSHGRCSVRILRSYLPGLGLKKSYQDSIKSGRSERSCNVLRSLRCKQSPIWLPLAIIFLRLRLLTICTNNSKVLLLRPLNLDLGQQQESSPSR